MKGQSPREGENEAKEKKHWSLKGSECSPKRKKPENSEAETRRYGQVREKTKETRVRRESPNEEHRNAAKYEIEEKLETPVGPEGCPPTELTVLQSLGLGDVDSPQSLPE